MEYFHGVLLDRKVCGYHPPTRSGVRCQIAKAIHEQREVHNSGLSSTSSSTSRGTYDWARAAVCSNSEPPPSPATHVCLLCAPGSARQVASTGLVLENQFPTLESSMGGHRKPRCAHLAGGILVYIAAVGAGLSKAAAESSK